MGKIGIHKMIDKNYPKVIDELETLKLLHKGCSIARYGDGEFNICNGKRNVSQFYDPKLQEELIQILKKGSTKRCLVAIPPLNDDRINKKDFWLKGGRTRSYWKFLNQGATYYSSFITRPDNNPWINNRAFYNSIINLWRNKDVILVTSLTKSLHPDIMPEAKSIQVIIGPRQHAYKDIDRIEKEIGQTTKPVLICLGATATVLAWRLAKKNIQGLDLGHIGCFLDKFNNDPAFDVVNTYDITAPHDTDT